MSRPSKNIIISVRNNKLATAVAKHCKYTLLTVEDKRFANNEDYIKIPCDGSTVREAKAILFLPDETNPNDILVKTVLFSDAIWRMRPASIVLVMPIVPYSRQDCVITSGECLSSHAIARVLSVCNLDEIITIDMHSAQLAMAFDCPVTELSAICLLASAVNKLGLIDPVVVSPDIGGTKRASKFAAILGLDILFTHKTRTTTANIDKVVLDHEIINNKDAIIIDDMIDSGNTIIVTAKQLRRIGARKIVACATHGVFSTNAIKMLNLSDIDTIITTDSISFAKPRPKKFRTVSVAQLIASAL